MKKLILVLSLLAVCSGLVMARDIGQPSSLAGNDKGGWGLGGKFFVGVSTICSPFANANMDNVMDWLIRPNAKVWYAYDTKITTYSVICSTGGWTGESCSLESGETLSPGGRIGDYIYLYTNLAGGCTVQIDYFSRRNYPK